jgi:hypothetical protein
LFGVLKVINSTQNTAFGDKIGSSLRAKIIRPTQFSQTGSATFNLTAYYYQMGIPIKL